VPYQLLPTADSDIVVAVGNDQQYKRLCEEVLERPDLVADPRFVVNRDRLEHRAQLIPLLSEALRVRGAADWLSRLNRAGIPAGAVRSVGAALGSPEALARDMVQTVVHPAAGELRLVSSPIRMSGTPPRVSLPPPLHGQHTAEVLDQICQRRKAGSDS
jgi:crotonobetainyl-CoA:carnitine CoA-transferase CaiB-like acyl-CoA transferase